MIRKIIMALIITAATSYHGISKNFAGYYNMINEAEEQFIMYNNPEKCFILYDRAFKEYKNPFVRDCYIAAQIAYYSGDSNRFMNYISLAFKNGMPLSAYGASQVLKKTMDNVSIYQRVQTTWKNYGSSYAIDSAAADTIYKFAYENDSLAHFRAGDTVKMRKKLALEEKIRQYINTRYLSRGIFPGDKILGINSDIRNEKFRAKYHIKDLNNPAQLSGSLLGKSMGVNVQALETIKEEYELWNNYGFNIFIHSTCAWQDYKDKLWPCVLNGYLSPRNYGFLEESSVAWNRTSTLHKLAKICDYPAKKAYYNILNHDPTNHVAVQTFTNDPELLKLVNENRKKIYMQKYEVDVQKRKLEAEKGFRFFFGFL